MHAPVTSPREIGLLKIVVFLAGAVLMALEILGSRVLAPNFGSSVYVWGSLISTFLVALSAGYASRRPVRGPKPSIAALSLILALAAALMLPCIVWPQRILDSIAKFEWDVRWSALAAAVVLFLPASLAMGMVTPFAVRIGIRKMEAAGTVSGGYSALSTAGSIAGTLAATFLLIPAFPVGTLLVGLAVTLLACAVVLARDRPSAVIAVLSAAAVAAAIAGRFTRPPSEARRSCSARTRRTTTSSSPSSTRPAGCVSTPWCRAASTSLDRIVRSPATTRPCSRRSRFDPASTASA